MTIKELQYFLNIFGEQIGEQKGNELKKILKEFNDLQKRVPGLRGDK